MEGKIKETVDKLLSEEELSKHTAMQLLSQVISYVSSAQEKWDTYTRYMSNYKHFVFDRDVLDAFDELSRILLEKKKYAEEGFEE